MSTDGAASAQPVWTDPDTKKLHELGYAQELRRRMSGFSNFAVSFTIISVLSGCLTLYYFGMSTGGPVDITWGWLLVGGLTLIVGLGMAEVCSAYPTAGGLYYWSAKLAKSNGAAWSWFTGWFNLLGQVAVTAGIDFGFAFFFTTFLNLTTGWTASRGHVVIVYAGILVVHALLNIFGVRVVAFLSDVSVWWHLLGVLTIVLVLAFVPSHHASASFVFTKFENLTGFHNTFYVFFIGLLLAQYTSVRHLRRQLRHGRRKHDSAGVDLDQRHRPSRWGAPARHRLHGPGLLRHGVGDREFPDDLRLLT